MCLGLPLGTPHCSDQLFWNLFHLQRDRHLRWLFTIKPTCASTNGLGWPSRLTCASSEAHHTRTPRGPNSFNDYAEMDWVSTRTPTPMVDDTATLRRY